MIHVEQKREALDVMTDFLSGMYEDKAEYPTVDEFLLSSIRNAWTYQYNVKAYVRKSTRPGPDGKKERCFDIATVNCDVIGGGLFTKWLENLKLKLDGTEFNVLFAENVSYIRFSDFFRRNGWIESAIYPSSFYLYLKGHPMSDEISASPSETSIAPWQDQPAKAPEDDGLAVPTVPEKNDPMRIGYGVLTGDQKNKVREIKIMYHNLYLSLQGYDAIGGSREMSIAKTELETSCMWAVKFLTK